MGSVFKGLHFYLILSSKSSTKISSLIKQNRGSIAAILSSRVDYIITDLPITYEKDFQTKNPRVCIAKESFIDASISSGNLAILPEHVWIAPSSTTNPETKFSVPPYELVDDFNNKDIKQITYLDFPRVNSTYNGNILPLKTISAIQVANFVNTTIVSPHSPTFQGCGHPFSKSDRLDLKLEQLSSDLLLPICAHLHYRFLKYLLIKLPHLQTSIGKFLAISKKREEDLQRTRDKYIEIGDAIPLVNVFGESDTFLAASCPDRVMINPCKPMTTEEGTLSFEPRLTDTSFWDHVLYKEIGKRCVCPDLEKFKSNFEVAFTQGQLQFLNWDNVIAAGGSVMACVLDDAINDEEQWYHSLDDTDGPYEMADIDLFLYGLKTKEEAMKKILQIFNEVAAANPNISAVATPFTLTLYSEAPNKCIQINLSLYRTKAEVLANFDIDSACIGYDGTQVFCLPRCRDAMVTRMNTINGGLNKISYIRLDKYRSRGFRFGVPEFVQVPMGKKMDKIKAILVGSSMKMKLLTDFGIVFEHDTNIRRWDSQEWPFGYTNDENRSIIRDAENDLFLIPRGYWGNEFESEGSCGMYSFTYTRNFTSSDFSSWKFNGKMTKDENQIPEILSKAKKSEDDYSENLGEHGLMNWFGAPNFKDWDTLEGKINSELCPLEFQTIQFETEFVPGGSVKIPIQLGRRSYDVIFGFTDSSEISMKVEMAGSINAEEEQEETKKKQKTSSQEEEEEKEVKFDIFCVAVSMFEFFLPGSKSMVHLDSACFFRETENGIVTETEEVNLYEENWKELLTGDGKLNVSITLYTAELESLYPTQ